MRLDVRNRRRAASPCWPPSSIDVVKRPCPVTIRTSDPQRCACWELKRLRSESGRKIDDLAASIGKSRGRLINVLDGKGTLSVEELEQLLDLLDAQPKQKRELLALGAEARKRPTRRPYTDLLPRSYEQLPAGTPEADDG
jgi:hypothetical protein